MLKHERANRKTYRTMDVASADIFKYMECFHNPRMRRRIVEVDQLFSDLLDVFV